MTTLPIPRRASTRVWRTALAGALGVATCVSLTTSAGAVDITPPPGYPTATLQAPPFHTAFEIDGNKVPDNDPGTAAPQIDWNDLLTFSGNGTGGSFTVNANLPGPYAVAGKPGFVGVQSTGIIDAVGGTDPDVAAGVLCGGGADASGFPSSVTIDSYPWGDDAGVANTNNKSDICTAAQAWELVRVTQGAPGDTDYYDQNHAMLYQYWTRSFDASGEVTIFQAFSDGQANGNCGDFMVGFDYDDNINDVAHYRTYRWADNAQADPLCAGGSWAIANPAITGGAGAAGVNTDVVPAGETGAQGTFGESAIDLTAAGLLDQSKCTTLTAGDLVIKTGQADGAQLIDLISMPPIEVSNCGPVEIVKQSSPAGLTSPADFTYDMFQDDGQPSHDATLTGTSAPESESGNDAVVIDTISVGETHHWNNVLAQPDYTLLERTPLPAGWDLHSIQCVYNDAFVAGNPQVTATVYANGAYTNQLFHVFPPELGLPVPVCTIVNSTSGLVIQKLGQGAPTTFDFTVNGSPVSVALGATSDVIPFSPGSAVTVTELAEAATPSWDLVSVDCDDPGNAAANGASIGVVTVASTVITCTFTNRQRGSITIDKQGLPAGSAQAFDFNISGGPDSVDIDVSGLTIPGGASSPVQLKPGTYTVTELEPPFDADWALVGINCTGGQASYNPATQSATVTLPAGGTISCVFTNNQRGPVTVDKSGDSIVPVAGTVDQFDVTYTVSAASQSYIDESISVDDAFDFAPTITVVGAPTVTGSAHSATWNGNADTVLYAGTIGARGTLEWTITVRVQIDLGAQPGDRDCDAAGSGTWNDVTLSLGGVPVDSDDACLEIGNPNIGVAKSDPATVTVNPDHTMSATYTIGVTNAGTGPGEYTLSDDFSGFPSWVTVSGATVTAPAGVSANATLPAAGGDITTAPVGLAGGQTHTYTVTVTFTAAPTATADGAQCSGEPGDGLFNLASIVATNGPDDDDGCVDIPRGQIVVTKATLGDTDEFDFTSSVPGNLINGQTISTTTSNGVASGNTLSAFVTPGSYTVLETPVAGWVALAQPCGAGDPAVVANGGVATCAFVNAKQSTIKVVKVADPAGSFDFTLSGEGTQTVASGPAGYTWTGLLAGDYDLTEAVPAAWQLKGINCVSGQGPADTTPITNGVSISLGWGEDVVCTFSDEAFGQIVVAKQTLPDGSTTQFAFDPSWSAANTSIGDGGSFSSGNLVAGTYTATELVPAGWALDSVACAVTASLVQGGNGSTGVRAGDGASVTLRPGDTVTCTFTNRLLEADLAIVKNASVSQVGAGGGFDWVLDVVNNGPGAALNVKVGDIVPAPLVVTAVSSAQFTCGFSGNSVTCTKPSMAVGESGRVTITVSVPATATGGTVVNVGTVEATTPDPNMSNNSDDASVVIVAQSQPVPTTTIPPVVLPPTGSNSTSPITTAALLLMVAGGVVLVLARRRRPID